MCKCAADTRLWDAESAAKEVDRGPVQAPLPGRKHWRRGARQTKEFQDQGFIRVAGEEQPVFVFGVGERGTAEVPLLLSVKQSQTRFERRRWLLLLRKRNFFHIFSGITTFAQLWRFFYLTGMSSNVGDALLWMSPRWTISWLRNKSKEAAKRNLSFCGKRHLNHNGERGKSIVPR